jgi:TatA/E family protein of Tat protein translocase
MFDLGINEIIIIVIVLVVFFSGEKKISGWARNLGRFAGEFKKGKKEIEKELKETEKKIKENEQTKSK